MVSHVKTVDQGPSAPRENGLKILIKRRWAVHKRHQSGGAGSGLVKR